MFECKNCHKLYKIPYKLHIDSNMDSELCNLIRSGIFQKPVCPYCRKESILDVPIIYTNTTKKFIIYYVPESYLDILEDDIIHNPKILNLPGSLNGRFTSNAETFTEAINAFEINGSDKLLEDISNGNQTPKIGLLEIK